jgi:acyl-CoA thioesterase-1
VSRSTPSIATAERVIVSEFLKAKSPSSGLWRPLVEALAFAAVLTTAFAAPASARTLLLVALGDSLTAGGGAPSGKAFPDQLQAALRAKGWDINVLNAGEGGDTAKVGLARYDSAVPTDADALIIEFGANDMRQALPPEETKKTLTAIIEKAKAAHLPTLVAGMRAASNLGAQYERAFDAIYPALVQDSGVALYPFFLEGVAGDPKLQPDGLHPNEAGYGVIVSRMLPAVEDLLQRAQACATIVCASENLRQNP